MQLNEKRNQTALITGALCGLGPTYAEYFAVHGYSLIVTGKDAKGILSFAEGIERAYGVPVISIGSDLSERSGLAILSGQIDLSCPDIFINNAAEEESESFMRRRSSLGRRLSSLQMNIVVTLTLTVLRRMINKEEGQIINVSPEGPNRIYFGISEHATSDIFIRQFTESLVAQLSDTQIKVQAVCPEMTGAAAVSMGGQKNFERNRNRPILSEPKEIVEAAMCALEKNKMIFTYAVKKNSFWRKSETHAG